VSNAESLGRFFDLLASLLGPAATSFSRRLFDPEVPALSDTFSFSIFSLFAFSSFARVWTANTVSFFSLPSALSFRTRDAGTHSSHLYTGDHDQSDAIREYCYRLTSCSNPCSVRSSADRFDPFWSSSRPISRHPSPKERRIDYI
jgi:hypothetical protein